MAIQTMLLKLSLEDSKRLLAELDALEVPWELRATGELLRYEVWIDGSPSAHTLDLSSPAGWHMRTRVEI